MGKTNDSTSLQESFSSGLVNAISKNGVRTVCPKCGFPMPVYPGRYPKTCPQCGEQRDSGETDDRASGEENGGEEGD